MKHVPRVHVYVWFVTLHNLGAFGVCVILSAQYTGKVSDLYVIQNLLSATKAM